MQMEKLDLFEDQNGNLVGIAPENIDTPSGATPEGMGRRFWSKVNRSSGSDGCWLWTAFVDRDGYGRYTLNGSKRYAHRVVLEWAIGPCPPGEDACHSCRNRNCVNPAHLRWDTKKANQADRLRDGTDGRGWRNSNAKLTSAQVLDIRAAVAGGEFHKSVAKRYGVSRSNVSIIVSRRNWKHLSEEAGQ